MTDAPERIGLLTDGLGYYALATAEESNTSTHYVRADLYDAQSERIAELESENKWQPIENAPRDGTRVLVTNHEAGTSWVANYYPRYTSGYTPDNPWMSMMLNHNHFKRGCNSSVPTHWMPLPTPPRSKTKKETP